jgi:hypothetical protein
MFTSLRPPALFLTQRKSNYSGFGSQKQNAGSFSSLKMSNSLIDLHPDYLFVQDRQGRLKSPGLSKHGSGISLKPSYSALTNTENCFVWVRYSKIFVCVRFATEIAIFYSQNPKHMIINLHCHHFKNEKTKVINDIIFSNHPIENTR